MPTIRPLAAGDCLTELTRLLHAAYASLAAQGDVCVGADAQDTALNQRPYVIAYNVCCIGI